MFKLILPYPVSTNRYWRVFKGKTAVSKEAKQYKDTVRKIALLSGFKKPYQGKVEVSYVLYPKLPKNWKTRMACDPVCWHKNLRCIDLDNAQKVLFDALNGIAFVDDKLVWRISGRRAVPDLNGARIEVTVNEIKDDY